MDEDTIRIGWEILVHKYLYYKNNCSVLEDWEYDLLEKEYKKRTNQEISVGFPSSNPSAQLISEHGFRKAIEFIDYNLKERRKQIMEWHK